MIPRPDRQTAAPALWHGGVHGCVPCLHRYYAARRNKRRYLPACRVRASHTVIQDGRSSSTSGSLKLCHRLLWTKCRHPGDEATSPSLRDVESPHARRDGRRRTVLPVHVPVGVFRPARVPSRIKTPVAAQSHRRVLVGGFCCRP